MYWFSKRWIKVVMIVPTLLIFSAYMVIPIGVSLYYSFTDFNGLGKARWVGLANYQALLGDADFLISLKNSMIVFIMAVCVLLPLSFFLSLLFNRAFKGNTFVKGIAFAPNIVAPVLIGLMWVFILDPKTGLLNALLRAIGLEYWQQEWIGGQALTPYMVGIVFIWQKLGFHATIFLSGLKMIPGEIYEAAWVDGANKWQAMTRITLPLIRQTILINIVLAITASFKVFELVLQLTGGGPAHVSELMVTYMYYNTFTSARFGYGMSIAVIAFLLSAVMSFACMQIVNKESE